MLTLYYRSISIWLFGIVYTYMARQTGKISDKLGLSPKNPVFRSKNWVYQVINWVYREKLSFQVINWVYR